MVKERNKSEWEKKQLESHSLNPSEREGGDLGPEPTKQIIFITETKERETELPCWRLQGSDNNTRQKLPSGYGPCDVEEGYRSTEVKEAMQSWQRGSRINRQSKNQERRRM